MRRKVKKSIDKKVFRQTAVNKKKINLAPSPMRGGIRL